MPSNITRRKLCLGILVTPLSGYVLAEEKPPTIEVWKSPTCGCCKLWIAHVEQNGFTVKTHETGNNAVRARLGMPAKFGACHTARVAGYIVEGHVPATDIIRMLRDKPDALGIAVPGMPIGSPGMDGPAYGFRVDPYDVLLVTKDGAATVFASHR